MNDILYHYTNWNALNGILLYQNNKCILRAGNIVDLNDPSEINYGLEKVRKIVLKQSEFSDSEFSNGYNKFLSSLEDFDHLVDTFGFDFDIYICSLSKAKDNFNMWKSYSENAKGVSIGFDKTYLKTILHTDLDLCIYNEDYIDTKITFNLFDNENLYRIIDGLSREEAFSNAHIGLLSILELCLSFKHKVYEYEEEYRFISKKPNESKIKNIIKDGKICSFFEIEIDPKYIKEIWIGPNKNFDSMVGKKTLEKIKQQFNLDFDIMVSEIPYRS